jgi:hypothetical protein
VEHAHPVNEFAGRRQLLHAEIPAALADLAETFDRTGDQGVADVVESGVEVLPDDAREDAGVRRKLEPGIQAATQEGFGQLLLAVAGDDDDRLDATRRRRHMPAEALGPGALIAFATRQVIDVELEAVENVEQIVREVDVGLVDFVDQYHTGLSPLDRVAERLEFDVGIDPPGVSVGRVLCVLQAAQGVEAIKQVLGLGGALDGNADRAPASSSSSAMACASRVLPQPASPSTSSGRPRRIARLTISAVCDEAT